ncbi:MAG: YezD family protein [Chthoniobacteraceae bacterium]
MKTMHATGNTSADWLEIVRRKATAMRFGSVHIVIHEGRVTQVGSTEKTRLPSEPQDAARTAAHEEDPQ